MRHVQGFTLIEALFTLLLVLLGLTGAARLQATLLAASAEAKARDEASALALEQLAVFQTLAGYADYRDAIVPGRAQRQGLLHTYVVEWGVHHNPEPDYKELDIRVRWPAAEPAYTLHLHSLLPGLDLPRFARQQLPPR